LATDADVTILGGGCAGLSVALRLAENAGHARRVVVLEAREAYRHDRTWCFWRHTPDRFDALIRHRWERLTVRSPERRVDVDCCLTPYQMLESGAFYEYATALIAGQQAVRLETSVTVLGDPLRVAGGWRVETSAGAHTTARIIDTRPPRAPERGDSLLWQSFLGEEVICERPVFAPDRADLMEFAESAPREVAFTYVLPLAPDRALIETTLFHPQPQHPEDLQERQRQSVAQRCEGAPYRIVRSESGILPMGLRRVPLEPRGGYVLAGLMGGGARPATGYAFQRIQRWAERCALALREGHDPVTHAADPRLTQWMDRLFLEVLNAEPSSAPDLFTRLFAHVPTPRLVRFLSDRASLLDRGAVVSALPAGLFIRRLFARRPTVGLSRRAL
jgi:lycopene beta-cyclase